MTRFSGPFSVNKKFNIRKDKPKDGSITPLDGQGEERGIHKATWRLEAQIGRMESERTGIKEGGENIEFETGKVVRNWAQTFECRPERFYTPRSEDEVIGVSSHAGYSADLDCEFGEIDREEYSGCWSGAFTVGYSLFVGMDDVARCS
jgi:hypothetical protein